MFSNLQIRTGKPHRRKPSMVARAGVAKRRVSSVLASPKEIPSMSFLEELFGDEFPEAFTADKRRTVSKSRKSILDLPPELLAIVCEDLSKMDIKRLRLGNKYLSTNVDLRIQRVYISPNRANLDCLQKILGHPRHRHNILEVIWDDAQLENYPDLDSFRNAIDIDEKNIRNNIEHILKTNSVGFHDDNTESRAFDHDDFFDENGRLTEVAKGILLRCDNQISRSIIAKNATAMGIEENYNIYQILYRQEQEIIKQKFDQMALRQVLAACPNLETVILTSEVWRPWNIEPVFHTPFYRSFPPGFRKPSVWPWLCCRPQMTPAQAIYRQKVLNTTIEDKEEPLPQNWRGYSIIASILASTPNSQISELIIYAGNETSGISHQLFATPNADFTNTMTIAQNLPLKRLKLSINSWGCEYDYNTNRAFSKTYITSHQLHTFLGALTHLEHLDFSLNSAPRRIENDVHTHIASMNDIMPHSPLPRLKFLALRNTKMLVHELFDVICAMTSAQHINLDNIQLQSEDAFEPSYFRLFSELRRVYADEDRPGTRPAFWLIEPFEGLGNRCPARMVCEELNGYLHHGGEMPFQERVVDQIKDNVGWVVDDRDEEFLVRACDYKERI